MRTEENWVQRKYDDEDYYSKRLFSWVLQSISKFTWLIKIVKGDSDMELHVQKLRSVYRKILSNILEKKIIKTYKNTFRDGKISQKQLLIPFVASPFNFLSIYVFRPTKVGFSKKGLIIYNLINQGLNLVGRNCLAFSNRLWLKKDFLRPVGNKNKYMYLETEIFVTEEPL